MFLHSKKTIYIIFLLILQAMFLESCNKKVQQRDSNKYEYLQLAEKFFKEGKYSKAYIQVNKSLKIDTN